ncbi:hypothetical protein ACFL1S_00050 [Pseudomonadota bacterium]
MKNGALDRHILHDLATKAFPIDLDEATHVLLLDVVEHLPDPENLVLDLLRASTSNHDSEWIVATGNVAFIVVRLMLFWEPSTTARGGYWI